MRVPRNGSIRVALIKSRTPIESMFQDLRDSEEEIIVATKSPPPSSGIYDGVWPAIIAVSDNRHAYLRA